MLSLTFSPALPHTLKSELCPQPHREPHGTGLSASVTRTHPPVKLCRSSLPRMEQIQSQLASRCLLQKSSGLTLCCLQRAQRERPERARLCSRGCAAPEHPRGTGRLESAGFTLGSPELGGKAECQHLRPPVTPRPVTPPAARPDGHTGSSA